MDNHVKVATREREPTEDHAKNDQKTDDEKHSAKPILEKSKGAMPHQTLKLLAGTHKPQALTGGAKKVFEVFR
jgi:hypothetical protein